MNGRKKKRNSAMRRKACGFGLVARNAPGPVLTNKEEKEEIYEKPENFIRAT
jgi:hypothetical protein